MVGADSNRKCGCCWPSSPSSKLLLLHPFQSWNFSFWCMQRQVVTCMTESEFLSNSFDWEGINSNPHFLIQDGFSSLWDQSLIVKLLRQTVADHNIQVVSLCQFYLPIIFLHAFMFLCWPSQLWLFLLASYLFFSLQCVLDYMLYLPWHKLLKLCPTEIVFSLYRLFLPYFLGHELQKVKFNVSSVGCLWRWVSYTCFGYRSWLSITMVYLDILTTLQFIVEYSK